ncbi:hypothetical protein COT40_02345 [Candidatus Peregrinibacteria bacterium CG08_land_8_20_14_0_20_41_10]|nr:MAG: hypothetical protein COT40_02345 [Candidatus Peregrinibacteria bacterium CG08_land_8_20_14_0_20_41_10]
MNQTITEIETVITISIQETLLKITHFLPNFLAALAVFLFGWGVGILVYRLVMILIPKLRIDLLLRRLGVTEFLRQAHPHLDIVDVIAKVLKGYVILVFLLAATVILKLEDVSRFLQKVINYIPDVIVAVLILFLGMQVGRNIFVIVKNALRLIDASSAEVLARSAQAAIIVFTVIAVLLQLNIVTDLVKVVFVGLVGMLALAGGLSLGLGGVDTARKVIEGLTKKSYKVIKSQSDKVRRN